MSGRCAAIAAEAPRTKTILLTVHTEDQYVFGALEAGIKATSSRRKPRWTW